MKGYTLIELIIVMSLFSIILLSVFQLSFSVSKTSLRLTEKSDILQDARLVLDFIAEEISLSSKYGLKKRGVTASYSDTSNEIFQGQFEGLKLIKSPGATEVIVFYYEYEREGVFTGNLSYGGGTNESTTAQLVVNGINEFYVLANPKTKILTLKMVIDDFTIVKKISLKYKKSGSYTELK